MSLTRFSKHQAKKIIAGAITLFSVAKAEEIYFKDGSNTTDYKLNTLLAFYNSLIDAVNNRSLDVNPNLKVSELAASYVPIDTDKNWQGAQFFRGAGQAGNLTVENFINGLNTDLNAAYKITQDNAARDKAAKVAADGREIGIVLGCVAAGTLLLVAITIILHRKYKICNKVPVGMCTIL
jgi:hypothetical protein